MIIRKTFTLPTMALEESSPSGEELPIEVQQFQANMLELYNLLEALRNATEPERKALTLDITDRRIMLETDLEEISIKPTADPKVLRSAFAAKTGALLLMADAAERTGYIHDSLTLYSQCYASLEKQHQLQGRFGALINRLMLQALEEPVKIEGSPMEDLDEALDTVAKNDGLTSILIRLSHEHCWGSAFIEW